MGESVTGLGIGRKDIMIKWHDSLNASCWSKRRLSVVIGSHNHTMSDGSYIQTHSSFVADWHKIGDYRQRQTDHSNIREKNKRVDYDYRVSDKVLIRKDGILRKAESIWKKEPWTITTVHTNGTIRIQCGTKSERINIWRVTPFSEDLLI